MPPNLQQAPPRPAARSPDPASRYIDPVLSSLTRPRALALCALPIVALFAVVGLAPLPYAVAQPGSTADVLGDVKGAPVITVSGAPTRTPKGELRMTTIVATGPSADVDLGDVVDAWFRTDRAVLPRDSVYPRGKSDEEVAEHNLKDMEKSQDVATTAALSFLGEDPAKVKVTLHLADVGGPSAGLLFSLGIVDKLDGDGAGGDLTGDGPSRVRGRSAPAARSGRSGVSR